MADKVNPTGEETGGNPEGSTEQPAPAPNKDKGSDENSAASPPEDRERRWQSERDKLREKVDRLEFAEIERRVKKEFNTFLSGNKDKYPDVDSTDLETAEGLEPEHLEAAAKAAQARYDKIRDDERKRVREVPEDSLTPEEEKKALDKLSEEVNTSGQSGFNKFIGIRLKAKRK